jgi:formylglycine-generating enzyme required for sulfatase activity
MKGMSALRFGLASLVLLTGWYWPVRADSTPREWRDPSTGMVLVLIPAGKFTMGSPPGEAGRESQERQHRVTISRPYYLGRFEVTQKAWVAVMGSNTSHFQDPSDMRPVEMVTWFDAQEFLERLSRRAHRRFRLPTEAEWEYACRAGTTTAYATGARLTASQANFNARYPLPGDQAGPARDTTTPVGSFAPNAWGLYDMHGNVWEWCADWHCPYADGDAVDPFGECDTPFRVIRGGSWHFDAASARSALRYTHRPQDRGMSLGFRVAMDVPDGE